MAAPPAPRAVSTASRVSSTATTGSAATSSTSSNNNIRPSALRDAARITDWEQVYRLCVQYPELARYTGATDGWTALHHCGNRRCPLPHVVQALIQAYPEALVQAVDNGWLPLHYACRFKAPTKVVQLMVDGAPHTLTVARRDTLGRTPLYYAVRYSAPPGVVELLVQAHPEAVLEEDHQHRDSALSLIWDAWATKAEGRKILEPYLQQGDGDPLNDGAASLRRRFEQDRTLRDKWNKVEMLLRAAFGFPLDQQPPQQQQPGKNDDDPPASGKEQQQQRTWRMVHATAAVKCHPSLFLLACKLYPDQIRELDQHDDLRRPGDVLALSHQTALHMAVSHVGSSDMADKDVVTATLLKAYPEACQVRDSQGQLPLHRAVQTEGLSMDSIRAVYEAYPEAVTIADDQGRLPLHWAATSNVGVAAASTTAPAAGEADNNDNVNSDNSILFQILQAHPAGAAHSDSHGCLPLHVACQSVAHFAVWDSTLQALYEAHPAAARTRTHGLGRLPLHVACANIDCTSFDICERLIELHPRAAQLPDRDGKLPLHISVECGKDWETHVSKIWKAYPAAIHTKDDVHGWCPLHVAAASRHCTSDEDDDSNATNNNSTSNKYLLGPLLEAYPEATSVEDHRGRLPLHLACASGKKWVPTIRTLYHAHPAAVKHISNVTSTAVVVADGTPLPPRPYQIVALTPECHLDCLYELVRCDPSCLMPFR